MEYTQGDYIQEDEVRWMDVHMGNKCTNSNGHGEGNEEILNRLEIVNILQKYVQSYKADNEI